MAFIDMNFANGGGGGHEMISTVDGVEAVTSESDNHVVSAYAIKNYSNRYTDSVVSTVTAGNNTVTLVDDLLKNDDATYEFFFELTLNASSEYEKMVLASYSLDTSSGTMIITLADAPTVDTRVRVDVTVYRA